jgi:hypothetical protein
MPNLTIDQMDHNALALAIALADVADIGRWTSHGDGVIGADVDGFEVIVSVQEDGTVSVARYDESGEDIEAEEDDIPYDVDAVRAAIEAL